MSKKVALSPQGELALKELMAKLKKIEPSIGQVQTGLVSIALTDLNESSTETHLKVLAEKLLTRAAKKKKVLERLEAITMSLDEDRFIALENNLQKVCNQFEKKEVSAQIETPKNAKNSS
jgi:DNA-binding transcriptional ArsR family regulator